MGFKDRMKEAYEEGKKEGQKKGSFAYQVQKSEIKQQEKKEEKQYQKDRLEELKRDKVPYCPKCHSTNITFNRKKLSLGRTAVGGGAGLLLGPGAAVGGAMLGGLTSKKGKVKCLNCGKEWKL